MKSPKKHSNRMAIYHISLLVGLLIFPLALSAQTDNVRINEFSALNQSIITDSNKDFSDWIELFNPTSEAINLKGWSLTDKKADPGQWTFPEIVLGPGEYLILFADGKDRSRPKKELHVNFKLSGDGEFLGLYDNNVDPITTFDPSYPQQQVDISYGYLDGNYVGFRIPTPGKENNGSDIINISQPSVPE